MTVKDIKNLPESLDDIELADVVGMYCDIYESSEILNVICKKLDRFLDKVRRANITISDRSKYLQTYLSGEMYTDQQTDKYADSQRKHADRILEMCKLLEDKEVEE